MTLLFNLINYLKLILEAENDRNKKNIKRRIRKNECFWLAHLDKESCYIIEGDVEVKTDTESVKFKAGDFVVFPQGLKCIWKINKAVKKHYKFG